MGRAKRRQAPGLTAMATSSFDVDSVFSSQKTSALVPELIALQDGASLEVEEGDCAPFLRALADVKDVRFLSDGSYLVQFRDGDSARLLPDEGRLAFASGEENRARAVAAFARAFGLRASQSGDPMGLSLDPETKKAFLELSHLHEDLSGSPNDPDLLREFANVSRGVLQSGLLHDPADTSAEMPAKVFPDFIELNSRELLRRMSGEDSSFISATSRLSKQYADRLNKEMEEVRGGSGPFAENPMAAFFNAASGEPITKATSKLTPEQLQDRYRAALIVSGQIDQDKKCAVCQGSGLRGEDPCQSCLATGHSPTGKYPYLTPFLDGKNPGQTHGIPRSQVGRRGSEMKLTSSQAQAIKAMRTSHRSGRRFFILRGPASSGKDTVAKEFCAGMTLTKVPVNLGGTYSSGLESAVGSTSIQSSEVRRAETVLDPETGKETIKMIPAYQKKEDGTLRTDREGNFIPVLDDKGEQALEPAYTSDSFSVSGTDLGEIGRSAHLPVCFVISDPDGQEKEFARMHAALGDEIASPEGRYVMVDSSSGDILPLHPSTTFVVTTNERPTLKNPEGTFAAPTASRATGIDIDVPSEKEEAQRIAQMVKSQLNLETSSDIDHKDVSPHLADLNLTEEEVMPFVKAQRKLVAAASESGAISSEVVARDTADAVVGFVDQLLDDEEGAVDAFVQRLTKVIRLRDTTPEQRNNIIRTVIADDIGKMEEQVAPLKKRIRSLKRGETDGASL